MNKHTDTTRPVDAPTGHAARYGRHAAPNAPTWTPTDQRNMLGAIDRLFGDVPAYVDPWTGEPETDRYWAHNNDEND